MKNTEPIAQDIKDDIWWLKLNVKRMEESMKHRDSSSFQKNIMAKELNKYRAEIMILEIQLQAMEKTQENTQ